VNTQRFIEYMKEINFRVYYPPVEHLAIHHEYDLAIVKMVRVYAIQSGAMEETRPMSLCGRIPAKWAGSCGIIAPWGVNYHVGTDHWGDIWVREVVS